MRYKLSEKVEKLDKNNKPYLSATLTDDKGEVFRGVNAFHGEFVANDWYGELEQNGKFWNLITPKKSIGNNFAAMQKSKEIKETAFEIQQNISKNVAAAQDRTAWMWAKTNASTLLANTPDFIHSMSEAPLGKKPEHIAAAVIRLATLIYNGEPTEPFSSPRTHHTSPSEDFPDGIDMYNHPLTTDTERAEMDSLDRMQ